MVGGQDEIRQERLIERETEVGGIGPTYSAEQSDIEGTGACRMEIVDYGRKYEIFGSE